MRPPCARRRISVLYRGGAPAALTCLNGAGVAGAYAFDFSIRSARSALLRTLPASSRTFSLTSSKLRGRL